ncbi:MAG: iron-sulfur cluster assembly accessory protein [Candidatus Thiodiazotropha sp.]
MSIELTDKAAEHVSKMLTTHHSGIGLRLATRKSGCSGFAYVVDYAEQLEDDDQIFESHGVKIVVDQQSLPMLDGMTIDFVKENALNEGFEFINPNVKQSCGCGESFNV